MSDKNINFLAVIRGNGYKKQTKYVDPGIRHRLLAEQLKYDTNQALKRHTYQVYNIYIIYNKNITEVAQGVGGWHKATPPIPPYAYSPGANSRQCDTVSEKIRKPAIKGKPEEGKLASPSRKRRGKKNTTPSRVAIYLP